jgi:hypothetical protein
MINTVTVFVMQLLACLGRGACATTTRTLKRLIPIVYFHPAYVAAQCYTTDLERLWEAILESYQTDDVTRKENCSVFVCLLFENFLKLTSEHVRERIYTLWRIAQGKLLIGVEV